MFNDDVLEKILSHPQTKDVSVGAISTMTKVFVEVLEDILEGNPYAAISELYSSSVPAADVSEF